MKYLQHVPNIIVLESYKGAKKHHNVKCTCCNHTWNVTLIAIKQLNKKYGTNSCPNCKLIRINTIKQDQRIKAINLIKQKFNILSEYDGRQNTTTKITVQNKQCGHIFESAPGNLLHRDVGCPVCNKEIKIKTLNESNVARQTLYNLTASDWDKYRRSVYSLTRKAYIKHESIINPNQYPRGLAGRKDAYHLDHIVPIRWCFDNGVPPDKCGHYTNLRMVQWLDNIKKRDVLPNHQDIPEILVEYVTP